MRALLAVVLLLTLAFAGCASKGGGGDEDDGSATGTSTASGTKTGTASQSASGSSSSTSSGTQAPTANKAPTGALAVIINGTQAAIDLTGTDQDGDALNWTLAFGDGATTNGTTLPTNTTHTYAVGTYDLVYNLTDGKASVRYNATVTVAAAAAPTKQIVDGEWTFPNSGCGGPYDTWAFGTPANGVGWLEAVVDAASIGRTYTAVFTPEATGPLSFVSLDYYDDADEPAIINGGSYSFDPVYTLTGTVPVGAVNLVFMSCAAGPMHVHYEA